MIISSTHAYVYLQMPQSLEVVTAGVYVFETNVGVPTGTFLYSPDYLSRKDAVALDPVELVLVRPPKSTVKLKGIFGALRDSSPDAWGRRIIEKQTGRLDLTEIDYLLNSPQERAGALSFGLSKQPESPATNCYSLLDLEKLLESVEVLQMSEGANTDDRHMLEFLDPGTSMGGARPKTVVEDARGLWLAKFPDASDRWSNARVEGAMLALAAECEIEVPAYRIVTITDKDILLVKRFDRQLVASHAYHKHRMVSGLTLLGAEDSHGDRGKWSYLRLADEVRRASKQPAKDLVNLFRRMVFNALISNTDDHPRNHAMIAEGDSWALSPAYDLTPNPLTSMEKRDLALLCGSHNRYANRQNLLSQCGQFKLSKSEASTIINTMQQIIDSRWREVLRAHGVTPSDCDKVSGSFNYPGFELDPKVVLSNTNFF